MTVEQKVLRDHALEWIAVGLVAFFIFSCIAFYNFNVDRKAIRAVSPTVEQSDRT